MSSLVRLFFLYGFCVYIAVIPLYIAFYLPKDSYTSAAIVAGLIFASFMHILYIHKGLKTFREADGPEKEETKKSGLNLAYMTFNRMLLTYSVGTALSTTLWFINPENPRLEPLTILLGIGTSFFAYFRNQFPRKDSYDLWFKIW